MGIRFKNTKAFLKKIRISSFNNISLFEILSIYFHGITRGSLGVRAAAASWSIFMSMFPFMIFFLLFISYLPYYEEIQHLIYDFLLKKLLPPHIFTVVNTYMNDRFNLVNNQLNRPNTLLLVFSVLLFIFLSSNGIRSLIRGFKSINHKEPIEFKGVRSFVLSIFIVLFFSVFLFLSLILIYVTEFVFRLFQHSISFNAFEYRIIINLLNFFLSLFIFFIGICFLYYLGRTTKISFRGVMPGAFLTTVLFTLTTYLFGYYIANFTRFNVLYGSIGSVLMIMLWVNISVTFTLAGYELNIALQKAKYKNSSQAEIKNL